MKIVTGKPISPGYAQGHAVILGAQPEIKKVGIEPTQVDTEISRFYTALDASCRELEQLQARLQAEIGKDSSDILGAHLLFLRDREFREKVKSAIRDEQLNLESAIQATIEKLTSLFGEADDPYLRERAADIRDLERRLLRHAAPSSAIQLARLSPGSIIVTRELLPSDLLEFDRQQVVGFVTEVGGETGHAAILARALGVPAVTGIHDATKMIKQDTCLLVDGQIGEVVLDPEPERFKTALKNKARYDEVTRDVLDAESRECITQDCVRIKLLANIGRPFEVQQVIQHQLDGVGLFRTEYLFLDDTDVPSFERQYEIYCQVASSLEGLPLVIRTFDLGGDKWPAFLKPRFETNPNLGLRGLRFSLHASQDLFRSQIRAVLHAAQNHDVRIMLPMVLGRADVLEAKTIILELADAENLAKVPPIGSLIETPSAVFAIEDILAISDFVSIGTNDLTQFVLAVDRNALSLIDDYTVLHPSVLRAVHRVIEAANTAGIPLTVCGEAASDPRVACLLVGLGAHSLSMSPVNAARVRYAMRASDNSALEELAQAALNSDSAQNVSRLVDDNLRNNFAELLSSAITV